MATGHKLVKEITDQFLNCKICFEPYKEPKTLVCLHTFCVECIQKHVDSDSSRSSRFLLYNRYVTCPLCRSKTEIPTGGVRRLQDNFLVSSLTDVLNRKRISKVPPCEICPRERPKGNNATHKCLDCAKLLCKSCVDLHMTTKVTQHHSLIDIEGEKDIECKTHPEEIVRYYCEPCEECVCVVCTFQEHRDHEICSFSDGFSKFRSGLDGLFVQCKDRLKDVKGRLETMTQVESSVKETRENIRDLAISYIQQVRAAERELMQHVEAEIGDNVEGYLKNKEWLQENYDNLQTTCNLAEIIMNDKGVEMLLLKKELQSKFSALLEPALPSVPENLSQNMQFVPGNVTLGHISHKTDNDADNDGGSTKHQLSDAPDCYIPKKRPCYTRDTQTENNEQTSTTVEVSFDIPSTTNFSHSTVSLNGVSGNDTDANTPVMKTDVSVNTMQSMADFSKSTSVLSDDGMSTGGCCVKCSAELKKGLTSPIGSLPVIDGDAPAIQDIIITNSDERGRQRRRRSLIKSRRTQTDLSLSSDSIEDALRVSSQESLNGSFRKYSNQNLASVAETVVTKSVGLDPIDFGLYNTETRNRGVNTTENVKVVVESRSIKTNTPQPQMRNSGVMTQIDSRTVDTQTRDKIKVNKSIATDYAGQRNRGTTTPKVITLDSSTYMPSITQESRGTWTEATQTTERSVATEAAETTESCTEPMLPQVCDQGIGVKPEVRSIEINTDPLPQLMAPAGATASPSTKKRTSKTKDKEKKEKTDKDKSSDKKKKDKEKKEKREKKKMVDSCTETDPVIRTDKETGTATVPLKDSWTATVTPTLVNTGCTPSRPATREAGIATNTVAFMDQATYTEVVKLVDNTTETVIMTCDGETLTERVNCQDAETSVDVYTETVETITDACHTTEKGCSTDVEWVDENDREVKVVICENCDETRSVVDTATSPHDDELKISNKDLINCETQTLGIQFYDKSIECDLEGTDGFKGATFSDMSTSTENLPYIGLLSDMDCDELILVPEVAIDVIGSDLEYEKIYNDSFPVQMFEASAQTDISSATLDLDFLIAYETEHGPDIIKPSKDNLVTVGVNTEHKRTFEKETCTTMYHVLSKGTNTSHIERVDKSTCTGSNVRAIQEVLGQSPVPERSTKIPKPLKKDVYVETDPALMDEKMIACINKLKTVSERLNSPTTKTPPDTPWNKTDSAGNSVDNLLNDLDKVSEIERKKNVMDLVAKTQAITKTKETKTEPVRRKAQPITTLKGRFADKGSDGEETKPQSASGEQDQKPQQPSHKQNSRRNNSAPPRIATVPNQAALRKSPKVPHKPINGQTQGPKSDQSATLPPPSKQEKTEQGPAYSTVPKTRHPRLPIISESRPSSTGSESSTVSHRVAAAEQQQRPSSTSSDKTLDFSSLKINAPHRQSSVSPTPPRRSTQKDTRNSRPGKKPAMEVIPTLELPDQQRARTGSSSSDLTDNEPSQEKKGFMKKLFGSKKKKGADKRNLSPSKSPKPGRKALSVAPTPPVESAKPKEKAPPKDNALPKGAESPKEKPKEKAKPFVYMRSRIFSIEQSKDDDKYTKPIVNKYCLDDEKPPVFDFAATFTKK